MMFRDPTVVGCYECGTISDQRVNDLLLFDAICPSCGGSLAYMSRRMRSDSDNSNTIFRAFEILMAVEVELNISMDDGDFSSDSTLEQLDTIGRIAAHVSQYLPDDVDRLARSHSLILKIVRTKYHLDLTPDKFQLPLLDALFPHRWETRLGISGQPML